MDDIDSLILDMGNKYDDDYDDKEQIQYLNSEDKLKSESFDGENNDNISSERGGRLRERTRSAISLSISLSEISRIQDSLSNLIKNPSAAISPKLLLDSPTFLSNANAMVQPSPTTGKLPYLWNKNCTFDDYGADDSASFFEDFDSSTFESNPMEDSGSSFFPEDTSLVPMEFSVASTGDNTMVVLETTFNDIDHTIVGGGVSNSLPPPLDDHQHQHQHQQKEEEEVEDEEQMMMSASGEDGYNWRKYGQKQVKCSDFPRSYYKCTHPNCPVKKKVERSYEGHITEIIYEKTHNHPEPVPNRRSNNHPTEAQLDPHAYNQNRGGAGDHAAHSNNMQAQNINGVFDHHGFEELEEDHNQQRENGAAAAVLGYHQVGGEYEHESKRRKIEANSYPTHDHQMSGATRAIREPRVVLESMTEIDILEDGYRWRKYGQKVVKGNPNPRSYYKCTSANCIVRKHVERAAQDFRSVITTYEGKHNHLVPAARNSNSNNSSHANSANQSVGHNSATSSAQSHHHHHHLLHRVVDHPYQVQNEMSRFSTRPPYGITGRQLMGGGHPNNGFTTSFGMMNQGLGLTNFGTGGIGSSMGGMSTMGMNMNMNMGMGMDMGTVGMNMSMGGMGVGVGMGMGMGMDMGMGIIGSMGGNMPVLPALPNYLGQHNQMGLIMPKGEPISESSINNIIINNNNNNNNMANGSSSSSTSSSSSVYHQILNMPPAGPQI